MKTEVPISQIMSEQIFKVTPETSLRKIKEIFDMHSFHHLPVVDKNSKIVGIIGKEDVLQAINQINQTTSGKTWTSIRMSEVTAGDIMTPQPIVLDPDDHIGLAADLFLSNKFHAAPVVEDERVVGIITTHDLLQYAFKSISPTESV